MYSAQQGKSANPSVQPHSTETRKCDLIQRITIGQGQVRLRTLLNLTDLSFV